MSRDVGFWGYVSDGFCSERGKDPIVKIVTSNRYLSLQARRGLLVDGRTEGPCEICVRTVGIYTSYAEGHFLLL